LKKIRASLRLLIFAIGAGLLVSYLLFIKIVTGKPATAEPFMMLALLMGLTTVLLILLLIWKFKDYQMAEMIIDNNILLIKAAKIWQEPPTTINRSMPTGGMEVFISCFGILLDSEVIKFNIDGVKLKNVEIGRDYIELSYGKKERTSSIRLLHGGIDESEMQRIIEQFRYETGIVPVIIEG